MIDIAWCVPKDGGDMVTAMFDEAGNTLENPAIFDQAGVAGAMVTAMFDEAEETVVTKEEQKANHEPVDITLTECDQAAEHSFKYVRFL